MLQDCLNIKVCILKYLFLFNNSLLIVIVKIYFGFGYTSNKWKYFSKVIYLMILKRKKNAFVRVIFDIENINVKIILANSIEVVLVSR